MTIPVGVNSSPPNCSRFEEFTRVATSEPLCSRIPSNRNSAKNTPISAPIHYHSLSEPKSNGHKKRWAGLDANLLPTANFVRRSAMLRACLDVLGDAPDAA